MIKGISGGQKKRLTTGLLNFPSLALPPYVKIDWVQILTNLYLYDIKVNC